MSHSRKVLLTVSSASFMASLDLFIVNIAFPDIGNDLGTSDATLSWVLNAYAIVFAALLVPAGRIADLVGHKRVFLGGLALFVAASAACAAAPSVEVLIGARAVQAAGAAALIPTSLALLLDAFVPARRAAAIAVWSAAGAVAAAAGPPIGGLLVQGSWRWVFLVNLPVGLLLAAPALRTLRESRRPDLRRLPDLLGGAVLILAIGGLTLGIVQGPAWGWGNGRTVASLAAAALGLGVFVARCARHPVPVVELDLLRVRTFAGANGAGLLFFAAFATMLLASVLFLTNVWGEDILTAGLQVAPGPVMAGFFSVPAGLLAARYGARAVAVPGMLLFAVAAAWFHTQLGPVPNYAGEFLPGFLLGGIGVGLTIAPLAGASAAALPPTRFATGSAIYNMSRQLGGALGVAVLVALVGDQGEAPTAEIFDRAWLLMLACALAGALAALTIGRPAPAHRGVTAPAAPATVPA